MPPPREQPGPANRNRRRPDTMPGGWLWLVILLVLAGFLYFALGFPSAGIIDYSQFMKLAKEGAFKRVVIVGDTRAIGELNDKAEDKLGEAIKRQVRSGRLATSIPGGAQAIPRMTAELDGKVDYRQEQEPGTWIGPLMMLLLPGLILLAIFFFFLLPRFRDPLGGGFLGNYIKSPARRYEKNKSRVTFEDVADMSAAKGELQEIVDFLKSPEKFQRLGAQIPKGVLLIGPPGTGKTLLARAVAGEAGVPFFSISGSEFIQMFVGVGASRVRDMFKTAKENAPCLLFIDEIDAVGRMRGAGVGGGSDEREQTLNQILSEMDGFQPNESVIVIAATNRPDVLDSALLRPGRFDRHVTIDRPTWQGRLDILKVHTRNKPLADDVNLEAIARKTIGMTGADLRNLANEAALLATRHDKSRIDRNDFERAADRVLMGPAREEILTDEAKKQIAYHEAGHALVAWLEPEVEPPQKVTVVPRGRAGGVTFFGFDEDRLHYGESFFKAELATMMGGRAAERLVYGQIFAGAEQDLKQATRRARYMVTHWGMSDRLGPMSFRIGEEHLFLGKEIQEAKDFSEETASVIDEEVQKLLREADQRAYQQLERHRDKLEQLVEALLQKEELHKEEIDAILGTRPPRVGTNHSEAIVASRPAPAVQPA
ncbi:MAG: ATP-dependent zinc metalloprotease FtsH [Planctomycetes bacterium]|nr:ATP-dependent zinc metalloprotease FtsH [Planctomycetota bacterium]